MQDITKLEKDLNEEIRKLIIGEDINKKRLLLNLEIFFNNKRQEDIDKLKPLNIRLFTVTLEILKANKRLFPVHLANLDYIYSYKKEPLRYSWKSASFDLAKDADKIKSVLTKIVKTIKLDNKKAKTIIEFVKQAIEMYDEKYSSDMEEIGVINKTKDCYAHLEYHIFDDEYRNEHNGEFNILLITQKPDLLETLPNNNGTIYSNLIFKEK